MNDFIWIRPYQPNDESDWFPIAIRQKLMQLAWGHLYNDCHFTEIDRQWTMECSYVNDLEYNRIELENAFFWVRPVWHMDSCDYAYFGDRIYPDDIHPIKVGNDSKMPPGMRVDKDFTELVWRNCNILWKHASARDWGYMVKFVDEIEFDM